MTGSFPGPRVDDVNRPFWEGLRRGVLRIQRCRNCGHVTYPPRVVCPACFGELTWTEASGTGSIYTYGVVHRPNRPDVFEPPFVVVVVELDEGPRLVSNLVDADDPGAVSVGEAVRVVFEDVADDLTLPLFERR